MDNISEQLIKMNKTAKDYFILGSIWCVAFILVFFLVLLSMRLTQFIAFLVILIAGVMYGAYKLSSMRNVEYEYIVVNRDMDIDKIVSRSSRKRLVSIKLNEVEEFGLFTEQRASALANRSFDGKFICCNASDEAYYLTYKHPKKGMLLIIMAMNERTKTEALKAIPRIAKVD